MGSLGVDPIVIPNGLSADSFLPPDRSGVGEMQRRLRGRTVIAKMARFDPDKRWLGAIEIVGKLKRQGHRPLLIARGGAEAHGHEVLDAARLAGLRVLDRKGEETGVRALLERLEGTHEVDVVNLKAPVAARTFPGSGCRAREQQPRTFRLGGARDDGCGRNRLHGHLRRGLRRTPRTESSTRRCGVR